jgi:hypothetical protein
MFPRQDSYSCSPNVDGHAVGEDLVLDSPLRGRAPKRALRSDTCTVHRHAQAHPGPCCIRVTSYHCFILLGVWQYKHMEELTVKDAPHLECVLGDVHLRADIAIVAYPFMSILLVNLYSSATT